MNPKVTTKRIPSCALCGSTLKGKGWFCSYRCEELEATQRRGDGRERYEQGTPLKRMVTP